MSRVGKTPVQIPEGVSIEIKGGNTLHFKGSKGELSVPFLEKQVGVSIEGDQIIVTRKSEEKFARSCHGLFQRLFGNAAQGVKEGFSKELEIRGVGYRVAQKGNELEFNLGFSHPVHYKIPEGVTIEIKKESPNNILITGIDKQLVGQAAAHIRFLKKPEPYKGKGIRYVDEYVPQKAGKSASAGK